MALRHTLLALLAATAAAVVVHHAQDPPGAHVQSSEQEDATPAGECTKELMSGKKHDIAIYGATGFMGRLAGHYLADSHRGASWMISGRDHTRVRRLAQNFGQKLNLSSPLPWRAMELNSHAELVKMAKSARVVVNFAGPYERNGAMNLIQAAMEGCAHYVDLSTEVRWNAKVMYNMSKTAESRGLAIVQSAGFNSMATDLLVASVLGDIKAAQMDPPTDVTVVWTRLNGGETSGMAETMQYLFAIPPVFNPYILTPGTPAAQHVDLRVDGMQAGMELHGFTNDLNIQPIELPVAFVDAPIVRRSINKMFPGENIALHVCANASVPSTRAMFLASPPSYDSPMPSAPGIHEGPPAWVMQTGSFAAVAIATGKWNDGKKVAPKNVIVPHQSAHLSGHGDPYTTGSTTMAMELALALSAYKYKAGYLTPAEALGPKVLEQRLEQVDGGNFFRLSHSAA